MTNPEPSALMERIIEVAERTFERYKNYFDEKTHSTLKVALEIAATDGASTVGTVKYGEGYDDGFEHGQASS